MVIHSNIKYNYKHWNKSSCTEDEDTSSSWINRLSWMKMNVEDFPMKTVMEISLNPEELEHIKREVPSNRDFENAININRQLQF